MSLFLGFPIFDGPIQACSWLRVDGRWGSNGAAVEGFPNRRVRTWKVSLTVGFAFASTVEGFPNREKQALNKALRCV